MPPRGLKNPKRKRQYKHIKDSARARGASTSRAEQLAARTVNKQRRKAGETKSRPRRSTAGKTSRAKSPGTSTRGKSTSTRGKSSTSRSRKSSSSSRGPSRSKR